MTAEASPGAPVPFDEASLARQRLSWGPAERPKVSVCMITYNHERYIRTAIESALGQLTSFPFEVVVSDDASSDRTLELAEEYAARTDGIVRVVSSGPNLGIVPNMLRALEACEGTYVAFLEGDDYWTDPGKLALQADLLDRDPGLSTCFHPVCTVDEAGTVLHPRMGRFPKDRYTIEDLIIRCDFVPSCSAMFRNRLFDGFPECFHALPIGDLPLHVFNAQHGDLRPVDRIMGAYRLHRGSAYWGKGRAYQAEQLVRVYACLDAHLGPGYHDLVASATSYWRANWCLATGDLGGARRSAAKRVVAGPFTGHTLKAGLMVASPRLLRAIRERRFRTGKW